MKDAPAFDFYASDWLAGTLLMSFEEKGLYVELLALQWEAGALPSDDQLRRLRAKPAALAAVLEKFPFGEDGLRRNVRLERERDKQRDRINKASEKGRKMAAGRWGDSNAQAMHKHPPSTSQAVHETCPPPTTVCKERESTQAPASGQAHAARDIAGLYPRQDAPAAVLEAILDDLNAGEEAETIRRQVAECAEHIRKAPGGSSNRYVPTARAFFTDRQWRSPEAFAARWAPAEAAGNRQAKPTRPADISDVDPRKIKEL
jgi:uncharacterized protein YdaU (DUF1376 family)